MNFSTTMTITGNCGCHTASNLRDYMHYSYGFTVYACSPQQEQAVLKAIENDPLADKVIHDRVQLTENVVLYIKTKVVW